MTSRKSELLAFSLVNGINQSLARLVDIWDSIGIQEAMRVERMEAVKKHIELLLKDMITEEENLKSRIEKNIITYRKELDTLYHELSIDPYQIDKGLTVLQLEKDLRIRMESLMKEKNDRLKELKSLQEEDKSLCIDLCATPYYIPTGSVPTRQQLLELQAHIKNLSIERECRVKIFSDLRQQIHQLMKEIGHDPETTLEKDAVCDDAEAFLLTKENISALQLIVCQLEVKKDDLLSTKDNLKSKVYNLWSRLEFTEEEIKHFEASLKSSLSEEINEWQLELDRLEELKRANMEEVIEKIRKELLEFWDKCTYSTEQRESFAAFYDSNFTEELLVKHEDELSRLKSYYEKCKSVFEAVERWEQNWRLFQDFERKASDPSRFSNRGGSLLKESKERTKVQKLLPKLEEEIKSFIDTWEAEQGTVFLVRGQRFMDYVAKLWEDYKLQKEKEKNERMVKKGDTPVLKTPPVKRPNGGPLTMSTPNKNRKLNGTNDVSVMRATINGMTTSSGSSSSSTGSTFYSITGKPPLSAQKTPFRSRLPPISQRTPLQEFNSDKKQFSKPPGTYVEFTNTDCAEIFGQKDLVKKSSDSEAILNSTTKDILH
ncbi:protein regulator of cytokinesis 1 isoform X1 [Polypterus senegalus]|uniref:protein regulator of cytokinesis 1 isoform X1 n=1 Tax=Polypterus senegalus TaxID=55291 RepID=UPI0019632744|nr:protein regulator of cytokinesis 1 isoform X1 [Polypterus senegalus]